MAGIQRFVTYLYLYEQDRKVRGTGFARIEIRGGQCRMEIHMKEAGITGETAPVYLFAREQGRLSAVEVGAISLKNGNGDYKGMIKSSGIAHSPYNISDMKGILIPVNDRYLFASQWDDEPILRRDIVVWKPEIVPPQNRQAQELQPESTPSQDMQPQKLQQPSPYAEGMKKQSSQAQGVQQEAISGEDKTPVTIRATEMPMYRFIQGRTREQETLLDCFLRLEKCVEDVDVFETEHAKICGIHIELRDIRKLPQSCWYLGNNSFLLHGFFNYRYLLLGKRVTEGREEIFLGVPGVAKNQERVMAALFGFTEFLPENAAELKDGSQREVFGYWCHTMSE